MIRKHKNLADWWIRIPLVSEVFFRRSVVAGNPGATDFLWKLACQQQTFGGVGLPSVLNRWWAEGRVERNLA